MTMSSTLGGKHAAHLFSSFRERLSTDLDSIETDLHALVETSRIINVDPNRHGDSSIAFVGFAKWGWAPSDDEQLRRRRDLSLAYDRWWQRFETLFPGIQRETRKSVTSANGHIR